VSSVINNCREIAKIHGQDSYVCMRAYLYNVCVYIYVHVYTRTPSSGAVKTTTPQNLWTQMNSVINELNRAKEKKTSAVFFSRRQPASWFWNVTLVARRKKHFRGFFLAIFLVAQLPHIKKCFCFGTLEFTRLLSTVSSQRQAMWIETRDKEMRDKRKRTRDKRPRDQETKRQETLSERLSETRERVCLWECLWECLLSLSLLVSLSLCLLSLRVSLCVSLFLCLLSLRVSLVSCPSSCCLSSETKRQRDKRHF